MRQCRSILNKIEPVREIFRKILHQNSKPARFHVVDMLSEKWRGTFSEGGIFGMPIWTDQENLSKMSREPSVFEFLLKMNSVTTLAYYTFLN